MKPTKYSILPQSNTRARVPIASWLWLGILNCLALVIWHQNTEPKALSNSLSGPAWVRDIEPCQGVLPGDGHVITATFQHSSGDVIDLVWSDDESRNLESIGTTSNHPFYSFDRGDYVQAGSLQEGERLLTYSGDTKRVVSKLARPGPETVYNLEVFGEHVYFIGHDGVLVHNSDSYGLNAGAPVKGDFHARTNADGLPVRVEGVITGPHPKRAKGSRPEPIGGREPGHHRGHLVPENMVDNPSLVNVQSNIISEASRSNLSPKKIFENFAGEIARNNPNSVVRTVHFPKRAPGEAVPFAVTHYVTVDGKVVHGLSIFNR